MDINAIERQSSTPGLISGTMLVIATVVGGGMFSLPIAMAGVWFPGASVILLFIAIMMLLTGLMLVEVNLHYGAGASFNTFTQDLLGRKWNIVVGIAFGFVLYILTYAYISGSSAVMAQTVFKYSGVRFPANISVVIVSMLVGAIAWYSSLLVGRITTVLIIGKFVAFFATFSGLIGHIEVAKLIDSVAVALPNSQYLPYILMTLPFCIISFGFHGNVPSLVKLYGTSGVSNITRSIIIGTLFALLLYIFWLGVTMGNISRSSFPPIIAKGGQYRCVCRGHQRAVHQPVYGSDPHLFRQLRGSQFPAGGDAWPVRLHRRSVSLPGRRHGSPENRAGDLLPACRRVLLLPERFCARDWLRWFGLYHLERDPAAVPGESRAETFPDRQLYRAL
ncbi:tryptophan permease [Citrobacter freundii]|nr:tryptophan permease [Citrobacter freundii]